MLRGTLSALLARTRPAARKIGNNKIISHTFVYVRRFYTKTCRIEIWKRYKRTSEKR